ncbi:unnamed protein product (macronuclear) [Paramecium tetraurelia]|uniref:Protein kinase domain-containing protein n=1 Tax=Paramecium tetraurelia TaxID=5888 RepID=A0BL53_PARTE|nr:uncharacterized protein GSPATT00029901001 [Paramecium tetraurelia]CAK59270.1 unnamed protein product [Paramecium tetraurelia]|eukprot:XP_001426668.1 hypothetical protein (macronuclear) [Paramecium tetraurelia strain d4-2]
MSDSITESNSFERNANAVVLDHKYFLVRLIYKGRSHNLYLGNQLDLIGSVALNKDDPNIYYLVEMKSQEQYNSFVCDERIIKKMHDCTNYKNSLQVQIIPKSIQQGIYKFKNMEYRYNIKERCGPSLKLCFQHQNRKFADQVFATLAIEAISVLEKMHSASMVHCYLKPKKFVTMHRGVQLLLTDLKFAQKYKLRQLLNQNTKNKFQYALALNKYSSLNLHLGIKPCPRDDLESLAYILINFYVGGRLFKTKQKKTKSDKIKEVELQKMNLIIEKAFPSLPKEIIQFYYHVKLSNIDQYKVINYDELKAYFYKMMQKNNNTTNLKSYPWNQEMIEPPKQNSLSSLTSVVEDDENESDDSLIEEQSILSVIEQLKQITKTKKLLSDLDN